LSSSAGVVSTELSSPYVRGFSFLGSFLNAKSIDLIACV